MNREIENELLKLFTPPPSPRKDTIIKTLRAQKVSAVRRGKNIPFSALFTQAGFIPKGVWALSSAIFLFAAFSFCGMSWRVQTFVAAALSPMMSALAVLCSFRSAFRGMAELEAATKYSLSGILFARIAALGVFHLMLIAASAILLGRHTEQGIVVTGAYITIPYLTTAILGTEAERSPRLHGNPFVSLAIGAAISGLVMLFYTMAENGYPALSLNTEISAAAVIFLAAVYALSLTRLKKEVIPQWS